MRMIRGRGSGLPAKMGMLSLVDAMLFFVILLIASGLLLHIGVSMSESAELVREQQMADYCDMTRMALSGCNIPYVEYSYAGQVYERQDASVEYLLVENLYFLRQGVSTDDIRYADAIRAQVNLLVDPVYDWALRGESGGTSISIYRNTMVVGMSKGEFESSLGGLNGREGRVYDVHASSWKTLSYFESETVEFGFYVWLNY